MHPLLLAALYRDASPEQKLEGYRDMRKMFITAIIVYLCIGVGCALWYVVDMYNQSEKTAYHESHQSRPCTSQSQMEKNVDGSFTERHYRTGDCPIESSNPYIWILIW